MIENWRSRNEKRAAAQEDENDFATRVKKTAIS